MDGPSTPAEDPSAQPAGGAEPEDLRAELDRLRAAHEKRGERLAAERVRFADLLAESERRERDLRERVGQLEEERARLETEVAEKEAELQRLLNTRTFRWTAGLRRVWGRLRGGRGTRA